MMAGALESRGRTGAPGVRCGRCGRRYEDADWARLELIDRVEGRRLEAVVTVWPDERAIEVRRCAGCASALARTVISTDTR